MEYLKAMLFLGACERGEAILPGKIGLAFLLAATPAVFLAPVVAGAERPAVSPKIYSSTDRKLDLGVVHFAGGNSLHFSAGLGSGAYRHPSLPPMVLQTVTDRGPRFSCKKGQKWTGLSRDELCSGTKGARIYPLPAYAPSIYTIRLEANGRFRVLDVIALRDRDGKALTGLPNPLGKGKAGIPFDAKGRRLQQDAGAVDPEAMVRLADGSYWIADEGVPSILHVSAAGRVLLRMVPQGMENDLRAARYPVSGGLPAILSKRRTNRGIESLALSPDERFLYFALQSPLANPDTRAFKRGRNVRLFKFDRKAGKVIAEFVYVLDRPEGFRRDDSQNQRDVKISEMMAIGPDRLLVLERVRKSMKLFAVDLGGATNILGSRWDAVSTRPSLEQTPVSESGIRPVSKALRFDSDAHPEIPAKIEAMALLGDGTLALINDNDFGLEGERTLITVIKVPDGK
ncbi:MAG: esterase-like activity of phytase family protein [Proteobacteria bacterium]|nr:esterase-like activity of phytase family protein [Pseudomonadota bacterium]